MEIFWHCSDSLFGDVDLFREWHKARGWTDIGYHFVVLNGRVKSANEYNPALDGIILPGRDLDGDGDVEDEVGAHAYGHNRGSLAICLVGKTAFSPKQMGSIYGLTLALLAKYNGTVDNVHGHYEVDNRKTCPNLNMVKERKRLLAVEQAHRIYMRYPSRLFYMEGE
jgi:hypothetical protein